MKQANEPLGDSMGKNGDDRDKREINGRGAEEPNKIRHVPINNPNIVLRRPILTEL
jgi:hypothetical protein